MKTFLDAKCYYFSKWYVRIQSNCTGMNERKGFYPHMFQTLWKPSNEFHVIMFQFISLITVLLLPDWTKSYGRGLQENYKHFTSSDVKGTGLDEILWEANWIIFKRKALKLSFSFILFILSINFKCISVIPLVSLRSVRKITQMYNIHIHMYICI